MKKAQKCKEIKRPSVSSGRPFEFMWLFEWQFLSPRIRKASSWEAVQPQCPLGIHSEGSCYLGLLGGSIVKNLPVIQETQVRFLGWEDPLEEGMATHSSILPWRIPMVRGAWRPLVHGAAKSWTRLSDEAQHSIYIYRVSQVAKWKEFPCSAWDLGSIPGSGRSPGGGHGNPLQYSCQENPLDRGAWRATVHRVAKPWIWLKWLSSSKLLLRKCLHWFLTTITRHITKKYTIERMME